MFKAFAARHDRVSPVLIACWLCAGWPVTARTSADPGSEFLVESWTVADGLPSPSVVGLARDHEGSLWVGTNHGLARFDGLHFRTFTHENLPGLRSDYVEHMAAGPDGQLYIATWGGGLSVYNHGRARALAKAEGTKSNVVQVVLPVGDDEAWFGTDIGYLYHYRNGSVTETGANLLPRVGIYGLAKGLDGTLWIGTGKGLFYLKHGEVFRYRSKIPLPITGIFDLAVTDAGNIFVGSDRGVFEIEGDHWRSWTGKDGLPSERIQVMAVAPGNVLWVGTDAGVAQLVHGRTRSVRTPFCSVSALTFDMEESLWIGCSEGHTLLQLRKPAVRMLPLSAEHRWISPGSLVEDKRGPVWMGTGHGLLRWSNGNSVLYTRRDGLPTNMVTSVSLAPDDSIWIGTEDGFARLRNGKIQSFRTRGPGEEDTIFSIQEDHAGNLWVVTSNRLLRRARGQARFEEVPNIKGFISTIREDRDGNMLAATRNLGLIRLSDNAVVSFTTACGLASNMVYDVAETAAGDLWVASEGGLSRIRGGKCASIREENGQRAGRVVGVKIDSQDHLWIKTSSVTEALSLQDANRVVDHGGVLTPLRILRDEDGFGHQLNVASPNSILLHSSGEMWFSTLTGVGTVDPAILQMRVPPLKARVDSLVSDAGGHDLTQLPQIRPGDRNLRFTYNASSLIASKACEFRYRLTGFDKSWRSGGSGREAVYTRVPTGTYRFEVSVRRPFENWSEASVPVEVQILPQFYQTGWGRLLLIIAFIALVLSFYQLRLAKLRRHCALLLAERLRERRRLARELHDTLARGMLGIHSQVQAAQVLLDAEPCSVRKYLDNVESIAREALLETRSSIRDLRTEAMNNRSLRDILRTSISDFNRSSTTIDLTATVTDEAHAFSAEINDEIRRFAEEALTNVRLHSDARRAYLNAHWSGETFLLDLRDDGKGFDINIADDISADHFGLIGMRERAKRIKGRVQITSSLGQGTRVLLEVPFLAGRLRRCLSGWSSRLTGGNESQSVG